MSTAINDTCRSEQYGSPCQYDWSGTIIDGGCCVDESCSVDCLIDDDAYHQSNLIAMTVLLIVMLMMFAFLTVKWRRQWEQRMLYAAMMQHERDSIMQTIMQSNPHVEMQVMNPVIEYEDHHMLDQLNNQANNQPLARSSSQPIQSSSQTRFEPYSGNSFRLGELSESRSLDSFSQSRQSNNLSRSHTEQSDDDEKFDLNSESDEDDHERPGNGRGPYQLVR